jgi:hypothetical protein
MVNSHRYYPYPVLSEVSDDYHDSSFLANVEYSYSQDFLEFSFKADTDNKGLFDLIDSDHAVFAFHMECPQTSYRRVVTFKGTEHETRIRDNRLSGKLQVCPFIVATKPIVEYSNDKFNSDYQGFKFNLEAGSVLAIASCYEFTIQKEKDELSKIPSIFYITKHQDKNFKGFDITYPQDRIGVLLGEKEYQQYRVLNNNALIKNTLITFLILPALAQVLKIFKSEDPVVLEQYSGYRWFKSIQYRADQLDIDLAEIDMPEILLAQTLLNYPVLSSLFELADVLLLQDSGSYGEEF